MKVLIADDSPVLVTVAAGLFIVPFFLFSATAGQFADKIDKARMIQLIKLGEIAIMFVGALGFFLSSVELLMVVLFAMGAQSAFFGPVGLVVAVTIGLAGVLAWCRSQPLIFASFVSPLLLEAVTFWAMDVGLHPRYFAIALPIVLLVGGLVGALVRLA